MHTQKIFPTIFLGRSTCEKTSRTRMPLRALFVGFLMFWNQHLKFLAKRVYIAAMKATFKEGESLEIDMQEA